MRATLLFSLFLFGLSVVGQDTRITKDFNESFTTKDIRLLEIENKYGDVIINTWKYDSVKIVVAVEAFGKTQELANREISKVDVKIRRVGSMITAVTTFEQIKSKGFFGELLSEIEDVSKSFVGNSKLTIDYEVWMPTYMELNLNNKYGDAFVGQLKGNARITLAHGDLRADQMLGEIHLDHSFGKHTINLLNNGYLTLRGVTSDISKANKLSFESSSSQIYLGKIDELKLDNRNDKLLVDEAKTVSGKGSFTDLTVKKLSHNSRLDFSYGEIYLDQILKNFEYIRIDGKSTDINLIINQGSYIKTYIEGDQAQVQSQMILPNSMLTMNRQPLQESDRISLTGMVGNTQVEVSDLYINTDQGSLIISIEETDMFTNKD